MDYFGKVAHFVKSKWINIFSRLKAYFKRLLIPLYLFPIKLITYTAYYLVKFLIKFVFAVLGLIWDCIKFPFKSLKNFLRSIVYGVVVLYLAVSLFVISDYIETQYGWWTKFLCSM